MIRWLPLLVALGACNGGTVILRGRVMSNGGDKAHGLPGATIEIRDAFGAPFDEDETDANGRFRVTAPRGNRIYAVTRADGYVPATFTGSSGFSERLDVEDGLLYGVREGDLADWVARFEGCPGLTPGAGGVAVGRVREFNLVDPETGEHPRITTARVGWQRVDGLTWEACYLDADGLAYDGTADVTGDSGWYLIPGIEPGVGTLVVEYTAFDPNDPMTILYDVFMVSGGVHPRFPTWVDSPITR